MMNCFEFEQIANEQLNQRSALLPPEWSLHVNDCPGCHAVWIGLLDMTDSVAVWNRQSLEIDVADAVIARWSLEQVANIGENRVVQRSQIMTDSVQVNWTGRGALLASAIALLAMIGIGWRISSTLLWVQHQNPGSTTVKKTVVASAEPTAQASAANERQLDTLLSDAKSAYSALATQAWQHVSTARLLIPPTEVAAPFQQSDVLDGLPESLSRPLTPIRDELREAFDLLFDQTSSSQDSST